MDRTRHFAALLALCALLVVTTVSVLPGHNHENDSARPCDLCHSVHLPCVQPAGEIQLSVEMPVVWHQAAEDFERRLDCASVIRSPRAPPV